MKTAGLLPRSDVCARVPVDLGHERGSREPPMSPHLQSRQLINKLIQEINKWAQSRINTFERSSHQKSKATRLCAPLHTCSYVIQFRMCQVDSGAVMGFATTNKV